MVSSSLVSTALGASFLVYAAVHAQTKFMSNAVEGLGMQLSAAKCVVRTSFGAIKREIMRWRASANLQS